MTKILMIALLLIAMFATMAGPVYAQAGACKLGAHLVHGTCVASGNHISNRLCPKYPYGTILPPHNPFCR